MRRLSLRTTATALPAADRAENTAPGDPVPMPAPAPVLRRAIAGTIDMMLGHIAALLLALPLWVAGLMSFGFMAPVASVLHALVPVLVVLIPMLMPWRKTFGMALMGLRLVRAAGDIPPDYAQVSIRVAVMAGSVLLGALLFGMMAAGFASLVLSMGLMAALFDLPGTIMALLQGDWTTPALAGTLIGLALAWALSLDALGRAVFLVMLLDPQRRCVHDWASGTRVAWNGTETTL